MVTGASAGIGLELVRQMLGRGDRVVAASRKGSDALRALASAQPDRLLILELDPGSEESVVRARRQLGDRIDALDMLINNAGVYSRWSRHWDPGATLFDTVTQDELLETFRINAAGPMIVTQHFLNLLRAARSARILNMSSRVGSVSLKTSGGDYPYAASKAALNIMTRALAAELAPEGIIAICITPGWVRTEMGGRGASLSPEESVQGILKVAAELTVRDAGRFVDYQGDDQPW